MATLKLYELLSQKNDELKTSLIEIESFSYRQYEMNRLNNLLSSLYQYKNSATVEENQENIKRRLNSVWQPLNFLRT